MPSSHNARARAFCFTSFAEQPPCITGYKYICYQREICPTTGNIHFQGFVYYKNAKSFEGLRKEFGGLAHIEIAQDIAAAIKYCQKEDTAIGGTFFEDGDKPECTKEKGWWRDMTIAELWDTEPEWMLRHHSAVSAYQKQKKTISQVRDKPNVIILWGPPGTGKSYNARLLTQEYYVKPSGLWWDGYTGQPTVIFDDFYSSERYCDMLRWLSENPIKVPVKGAMTDLLATNFVITSNQDPDEWYPQIPDKSALHRRITEIIHMTEPYVPSGTQFLN